MSLAYISNDNAFINQPPAYFSQRTLLTRFQMNNSMDKSSQFVRKPVMVAMALLSYLGPKRLQVIQKYLSPSKHCNTKLSVLAGGEKPETLTDWSASVVLTNSQFPDNCSEIFLSLRLKLPSIPDMAYVVYQLDNVLTNPNKLWKDKGSPVFPETHVLRLLRENEGPHVLTRGSPSGNWLHLSLALPCPSVTLVHLCARQKTLPAQIPPLHAVNVTFNEVLLFWRDSNTKCVKTYEVYFCPMNCLVDEYQLITNRTVIMLSYQFSSSTGPDGQEGTRGKYKVRVRDYWDQLGSFSNVTVYG